MIINRDRLTVGAAWPTRHEQVAARLRLSESRPLRDHRSPSHQPARGVPFRVHRESTFGGVGPAVQC
eukprot:767794-Hanusia_phi.AAC.1